MTEFRVFIVEDEVIVADDLAETLKSLGYQIAGTAKSGEQAIDKVSETRPDLVLMDIHLAGKIDGVQAAGDIHKSCDIPVIYLTAYADQALLERA
ncbi:MAG: response regulator, partial [Methanomicrobiales archaeon]